MKVIDLMVGMYGGKLPSTVSFSMYGDRYTAYLNTKTNRLQIEDYNQDEICISNYYEEIEILDDDYLEETKKEDLINLLVNDCGCAIENTQIENKKIEKIEERIDTGLVGSEILSEFKVAGAINSQASYTFDIAKKLNEIIDRLNGEDNE